MSPAPWHRTVRRPVRPVAGATRPHRRVECGRVSGRSPWRSRAPARPPRGGGVLRRALPQLERLVAVSVEEGDHPELDWVAGREPQGGGAVTTGTLEISEAHEREAARPQRRCRFGPHGERLLDVLAATGEVVSGDAEPAPTVQRAGIGRLQAQDRVQIIDGSGQVPLGLPRQCSDPERLLVVGSLLQDQRGPLDGTRRIASSHRDLAAGRARPVVLALGLVELDAIPLRLADAVAVEQDCRTELPCRRMAR